MKRKKADYILFYKPSLMPAVVEAKDDKHAIGAGMQQALEYAEILDIPFAYSSNGDAFLEHDRTAAAGGLVTREIRLDRFPSADELWAAIARPKAILRTRKRSPPRTITTMDPARVPATIS